MASNHSNRMDLTFQLLSCWFHFRITLPHIYRISDYFQITTGRGWTITWMEEWCFDTPRICNTVFLNLKLSNIYSAYDSRRSHLQLHAGMIKPFSVHLLRCPWEKVIPKRKLDPADTLFPLNEVLLYHCLEIHTSIHQGFGDLSWLLKVNIVCGKERGKNNHKQAANSLWSIQILRGKAQEGSAWSPKTQHPIYPKTSELWKATLFYWSKCNSLAPHAFVLSVVKLQTCLWY